MPSTAETVPAAIDHWFRELGVDPARGTSRRHEEVALFVQDLRSKLARLAGMPSSNVVLGAGAMPLTTLGRRVNHWINSKRIRAYD